MYTTHIDLKQQVGKAQYRDVLADAERERRAAAALAARPRTRLPERSVVRRAVATSLLRAGSWLMPEATPAVCSR